LHLQSLYENNVSVVCANINDSNEIERVNTRPFIVKNINGFRFGIFGLTTPKTPEMTSPWNVANVTFSDDLIEISQRVVKILRDREKCDVVILIAHLGWGFQNGDSGFLAHNFDGIDLIVDGHSHTELPKGEFVLNNDYQTLIVQTGAALHNVGVVDLLVGVGGVIGKRAELLERMKFEGSEEDQDIKNFLNEAIGRIENITSVTVGKASVSLPQDDLPTGSSKLGLLVASSMLFKSVDGDCALINNGGVRAPINEGLVTWGDLMAVLPFGDQIFVLNVSGADLYRIVGIGLSSVGGSAVSTIAGLHFIVNLSCGISEDGRILNLTMLNNNGKFIGIIERSKYYKLVTTDFLYAGGNGYSILRSLHKLGEVGGDLDGFADFIRSLPNQEITENLSLYESGGYDIVGKSLEIKAIDRSVRLKSVKDDGIETVLISEAFDAIEMEWHDKDGIWKPFYEYKVKAQQYIAKNVSVIKDVVVKDVGYVSVNGMIVGGENQEILIADGFESEPKEIENIVICDVFHEVNDDGVCVINGGTMTAVILAGILGIASFVCLMILGKRKNLRRRELPEETTEHIVKSSGYTNIDQ
jgi:2',3'-cyclic-nucleotide 2'-phosphodiesterase (5'-nucleotidase family)